MTIPGAFSGKQGGWLSRFLDVHLPPRMKRLVFLASLTARLRGSETFDDDTLRKLNKLMVLANSENALRLPIQLSRAIWNGKTAYEITHDTLQQGDESFGKERLKSLAHCVITAMPSWLRYGDDSDIEKDLNCLLGNRTLVFGK
jgi:hypothetical protein